MTPKELEVICKIMKQYNIVTFIDDKVSISMSIQKDIEKSKPTISKIEKMREMMPTEEELLYGSTRAPDLMAPFKDTKGNLNGS